MSHVRPATCSPGLGPAEGETRRGWESRASVEESLEAVPGGRGWPRVGARIKENGEQAEGEGLPLRAPGRGRSGWTPHVPWAWVSFLHDDTCFIR